MNTSSCSISLNLISRPGVGEGGLCSPQDKTAEQIIRHTNIYNAFLYYYSLLLSIYLSLSLYIYIYTHTHLCIYIYIYMYMCICIYIYIYVIIVCLLFTYTHLKYRRSPRRRRADVKSEVVRARACCFY